MRITQYNLLAQCYVRSAIFTHSPGPSLKCAPARSHRHPRRVPTARNPNPPLHPPPGGRTARRRSSPSSPRSTRTSSRCRRWTSTTISGPLVAARGYAGSWKCRTQLTANKKDGCGLFFKSDRFELLAQRHIEFNDIAFGRPAGAAAAAAAAADSASSRETPDDPESLDDARRALVRDCVGTLALLRAKSRRTLRPCWWHPRTCSGTPRTRTSNRRRRVDFWRRRRISSDGAPRGDDEHPRDPRGGIITASPGSEVHARMLRGFVPGDGDGDGERLDAIPGTAPLRSAYASALASGCVSPPAEGRDAALAGPSANPRTPTSRRDSRIASTTCSSARGWRWWPRSPYPAWRPRARGYRTVNTPATTCLSRSRSGTEDDARVERVIIATRATEYSCEISSEIFCRTDVGGESRLLLGHPSFTPSPSRVDALDVHLSKFFSSLYASRGASGVSRPSARLLSRSHPRR